MIASRRVGQPPRRSSSDRNLELGGDLFNLFRRVRYVDQVKETNELQTVTRVAHGSINLPSSSQSGVIERLEHTVERPWVLRWSNLYSPERLHRRLVQKIKNNAAASDRGCGKSEPRLYPFPIGRPTKSILAVKFTTGRGHGSTDPADYRHLSFLE